MSTTGVDVDVDLVPRQLLGPGAPARLSGQLSIGHPDTVLLRPDTPDLEATLARRVRDECEEFAYFRTILRITFRTGSAPIVRAGVSVSLGQPDVLGVPPPLLWAMDPLRVSTDVVRRRNISGGSTVKLIPGASDTNAKIEEEETYTSTLPHVVAYGEGESIAEWRFDATQAEIIDGVYRLPFVARTSWRVRCQAELAVAATCRERLGGLIPYRAELPPVVATIVMYYIRNSFLGVGGPLVCGSG